MSADAAAGEGATTGSEEESETEPAPDAAGEPAAVASVPDPDEDQRIYTVVVNHEEQYSIWLARKEIPDGWTEVGTRGLKSECLAYIDEVWTDLRPLSVRKRMEQAEAEAAARAGGEPAETESGPCS